MLRERKNPWAVCLRFALVGILCFDLRAFARKTVAETAAEQAVAASIEEIARSTIPKCQATQEQIESLKPYRSYTDDDNPDKLKEQCKAAIKFGCEFPAAKTDSGSPEKPCLRIYSLIKWTIKRSESLAASDCQRVNTDFARCKTLTGATQIECMSNVIQTFKIMQDNLADVWMKARGKLGETEDWTKTIVERLRRARDNPALRAARVFTCQTDRTMSPKDLKDALDKGTYTEARLGEPTEGLAIDDFKFAIRTGEIFRGIAFNTAFAHQQNSLGSVEHKKKLEALAKRITAASTDQGPLGPPREKKDDSTITGNTTPQQMPQMSQQPQQQGGSPQGGGGSPQGGGGSPQGGGPSEGYPDPNAGGAGYPEKKAGGSSKPGDKSGGARVGDGGPQKDLFPKGDAKPEKVAGITNGGFGSSGFGFGDSGMDGGKKKKNASFASSGSRPASSGATGGGGGSGGGGGGGGKADPNCEGPDCQAVTPGNTSSQFAGTGSLGGAPFSLGGLDTPAPLDNLFKTDSALPAGDLGALGGLDGGLGSLDNPLGLGPDGETQASGGEGGEIGGREGADLFERVKTGLVRAQKRGLVAGISKKL